MLLCSFLVQFKILNSISKSVYKKNNLKTQSIFLLSKNHCKPQAGRGVKSQDKPTLRRADPSEFLCLIPCEAGFTGICELSFSTELKESSAFSYTLGERATEKPASLLSYNLAVQGLPHCVIWKGSY